MLTFSNFIEGFRAKIDPAVARQRKIQKLNQKISSAHPSEQQAIAQEKQQYVKDIQAKKTAALHKMLKARGKR
jgi:hypothetical protein